MAVVPGWEQGQAVEAAKDGKKQALPKGRIGRTSTAGHIGKANCRVKFVSLIALASR